MTEPRSRSSGLIVLTLATAVVMGASAAPGTTGLSKSPGYEESTKRGEVVRDAPEAEAPDKAPATAGNLTPADQAVIAAAIGRLKRDLLAECMLTAAERKALGPGRKAAAGDDHKAPAPDQAALLLEADKRLTIALGLAEKKGKVPANLAKRLTWGMGEETLIGLALVKAGVSPNHPLIEQIWDDLRKGERAQDETKRGIFTYKAGLGLMLVEAMEHSPSGDTWPPITDNKKVSQWVNRVAGELMAAGYHGGWGYGPVGGTYHDHSNTQYAALGLKAARLSGWKPDATASFNVWDAVRNHFLKGQAKTGPNVNLLVQLETQGMGGVDYTSEAWKKSPGQDHAYEAAAQARGWAYRCDKSYRPDFNMTIAGLTAMILARSELGAAVENEAKEAKRKADAASADLAIRDAMAWVQGNWGGALDGYGLYGIERLGVLGNLAKIGGHDWYGELAPKLAAKVMSGENIVTNGLSTVRTQKAFYLLFLVRGTSSAYAGAAAQ